MSKQAPASVLKKKIEEYFIRNVVSYRKNCVRVDVDYVRDWAESVQAGYFAQLRTATMAREIGDPDNVIVEDPGWAAIFFAVFELRSHARTEVFAVTLEKLVAFVEDCFCSGQAVYKELRMKVTSHVDLPEFMRNCLLACPRDIVTSQFTKLEVDPFVCACASRTTGMFAKGPNRATALIVNDISLDFPLLNMSVHPIVFHGGKRLPSSTLAETLAYAMVLRLLACIPYFHNIFLATDPIAAEVTAQGTPVMETVCFRKMCSKNDVQTMHFQVDIANCTIELVNRFRASGSDFEGLLPYTETERHTSIVLATPPIENRDLTFRAASILAPAIRGEQTTFLADIAGAEVGGNEKRFNDDYVLFALDNTTVVALMLEACFWGFERASLIDVDKIRHASPVFRFYRSICPSYFNANNNNSPAAAGRHTLSTDHALMVCMPTAFAVEMFKHGASLFALVAFPPSPCEGHQLFVYRKIYSFIFSEASELPQVRWGVSTLLLLCGYGPEAARVDSDVTVIDKEMLSYIRKVVPKFMAMLTCMQNDVIGCLAQPQLLADLVQILLGLLLFKMGVQTPVIIHPQVPAKSGNTAVFYPAIVMQICREAQPYARVPELARMSIPALDQHHRVLPLRDLRLLSTLIGCSGGGIGRGAAEMGPVCLPKDPRENMLVLLAAIECRAYNYDAAAMEADRTSRSPGALDDADFYQYNARAGETPFVSSSSFLVLPTLEVPKDTRTAIWSDALQVAVDANDGPSNLGRFFMHY